MLSRLVVLFAVTLVSITEIYGEPALNLDDLLNVLETRQKQDRGWQSDSSSSSGTSDTSAGDDEDVALQGTKLVRFLQQARDKQNYRKLTENKHLSKLYTHLTNVNDVGRKKYLAMNKDLGGDYVDVDNDDMGRLGTFVEYLLSQSNKKSYTKDKTAGLKNSNDYLLSFNNKKQQKEDKILKLTDLDNDVEDNNLQDYSRIYVILNPEALESSQNKKDLSALVSRLMSKTATATQNRMSPKQLQNKGFPVREVYAQRRSRRDSLEGGNSMEDNYRPRRPRHKNYYGGGGGGAGGGRTPIPYIRHRGDIYERDD